MLKFLSIEIGINQDAATSLILMFILLSFLVVVLFIYLLFKYYFLGLGWGSLSFFYFIYPFIQFLFICLLVRLVPPF